MRQFDYSSIFNPWLKSTEEYAAGKTFEYVMEKYGFKRHEILRLAGNESTIGTSPLALKAAQEVLSSSNYYDEPNSEFLIEAITAKFIKDGVDMSRLGIVVGNGMDSIIEHCLQLFVSDKDSIVNLPPTFIYYDFAAKRRGIEIINVKRSEIKQGNYSSYEINRTELLKAIKPNTKMVFLCSPNNPEGSITDLQFIRDLAQDLLQRKIMFFVDHAYIEFCNRKQYDARELIQDFPNMIIGYTFSKAYALAGFRVGYGLMHKELQQKYLSLNTPFLCARPSLAAARVALDDEAHLAKIIDNNTQARPLLQKGLLDLGYKVFASESNFVLFEAPVKSADLVEQLLSRGIIVRAIKTVSDKAIRVTVGTPAELNRLLEALS